MMRSLRFIVLAALLTPGLVQAGLFDDAEARKQIAELKVQIDTLSRGLLDLSSQLQNVRDENAKLRGQFESVTHEQEMAKKRVQDLYLDADTRLRKLEPVPGAAESLKPAIVKPGSADAATESQEYEAALNLFKSAKYKEASAALTAFVTNRASSPLAPGAQLWLGNALYAQNDCKRAVDVYSQLAVKWPESPKAPEALLALANCQQEMGSPAAARRTLESLLVQYPEAPAADTAKQRLKKR